MKHATRAIVLKKFPNNIPSDLRPVPWMYIVKPAYGWGCLNLIYIFIYLFLLFNLPSLQCLDEGHEFVSASFDAFIHHSSFCLKVQHYCSRWHTTRHVSAVSAYICCTSRMDVFPRHFRKGAKTRRRWKRLKIIKKIVRAKCHKQIFCWLEAQTFLSNFNDVPHERGYQSFFLIILIYSVVPCKIGSRAGAPPPERTSYLE